MKLYKHLTTLVIATLVSMTTLAADFQLILPSGPGSSNDLVGRSMVDAFNQLSSKHKLVPVNKPGGNNLIAWEAFNGDQPALILGNISMHVMNYHYSSAPLPYSDNDFDHAVLVGDVPLIVFASTDSGITTPKDLITVLPKLPKTFIATDNSLNINNVLAITKKYNLTNVKPINYKTATDSVTSTAGGQQPVGFGTFNPTVLGLVKDGKLKIVGSTLDKDIEWEGMSVPSISRALGVTQVSGSQAVSLNKKFTSEDAAEIKSMLVKAAKSNTVLDTMKKVQMTPSGLTGDQVTQYFKKTRDEVGATKQ